MELADCRMEPLTMSHFHMHQYLKTRERKKKAKTTEWASKNIFSTWVQMQISCVLQTQSVQEVVVKQNAVDELA